jgi:hypothetical protein
MELVCALVLHDMIFIPLETDRNEDIDHNWATHVPNGSDHGLYYS